MTLDQLKLTRLARQHLLSPTSPNAVVQDLCGLQAQYLCHALHSLTIRSNEVNTAGMVKSWTIRGTMHLFAEDDLPLFLHRDRSHFLRPVDSMATDAYITAGRKAYFASLIIDAVSASTDNREDLKQLCFEKGMTEGEGESIFNPWGGLIRALCEAGKLCHKVQEKKAYRLCPDFEPMEKEPAQLEMARRYFTHYGPATVKDAAYFFGTTQSAVKAWLQKLPVTASALGNEVFYHIGQEHADCEIPRCLFLGGFDPLLLGYEKAENIFLPRENIRDIFTLSGIVRPSIFVDGVITGWWNYKNQKLTIHPFNRSSQEIIEDTAHNIFPELKQVVFQ